MIWFAIALVLFACGGVALWLSRAPRRPELLVAEIEEALEHLLD